MVSFLRPILVLVWIAWSLMAWAAPLRADDADDQFAVAAGHYDRQRWKLAIEEFQTFLQKYPNDRRTNQSGFFLGEALLQLGQFDEARQRFQQYSAREPEGKYARPALFRAGEAAYLAEKFDAAKADLDRFAAKYPTDQLNAFVLPYLGDIALAKNDAAAAAAYYRDALKRFPEGRLQDDCRLGLARALEKQNQTEEAERLYLAVAGKTGGPLADAAQFHLGALQYTAGKYPQAVESFSAFETRLAGSPWRPNARLGHGWALMKLNRPDDALKMFEAVASDPKLGVEARYWIGLAQKAKKDWPAAAKTLLSLAEANPAHELAPALHFHAGDALLSGGDVAAAIEQFDIVLASNKVNAEWLQQAARGKVQAAVQAKDHAVVDREAAEFDKRFPNSPMKADVQRMLARSLVEWKEFARAAAILEPMIGPANRGPQDLENRYLLALAQEGLKRYEEALATVRPVVEAAAGQTKADAQLTQGSLLLALKRYGEAVGPLEAFLATKPTGDAAVKGMGELAICHARTGQLDKAKKLYAELTVQYPKHPLLPPTTEHLSEAAYDANDAAWSAELSGRLLGSSGSAEYELKGKLGLGWSRFKAGKLTEAEAAFAQVLTANPPEAIAAEAALVRGQILDQLNQVEPALAMYDLVIDKYPKSKQHCDALLAAARLRDKLNQDQPSAALYERLVKDYPQFTKLDVVFYEWAWVLQKLGKADDAANLFIRLRKEYPQSPFWADATYRLAQRAYEAKDYDQAAALVGEVLGGKADARVREYAAFLRGQIAVGRNDWPKAREAFEAFIKDFPENQRRPVAGFWIAETFYRQSDYAAAATRFDRLAAELGGKREAWMAMIPLRRAQILVQKSQWNEAHEIAAKIEADFPGFEQQYEVDYVLGRCLANQADFEGARQTYNKVIRSVAGAKTETAAMAQWMIGESFFHQKNYEAALREYLRLEILYAYPIWQAGALLQAGKCHELLGETKEAGELYRRILKTYPNTPFAEQAQGRLQNPGAQRAAAKPPN